MYAVRAYKLLEIHIVKCGFWLVGDDIVFGYRLVSSGEHVDVRKNSYAAKIIYVLPTLWEGGADDVTVL